MFGVQVFNGSIQKHICKKSMLLSSLHITFCFNFRLKVVHNRYAKFVSLFFFFFFLQKNTTKSPLRLSTFTCILQLRQNGSTPFSWNDWQAGIFEHMYSVIWKFNHLSLNYAHKKGLKNLNICLLFCLLMMIHDRLHVFSSRDDNCTVYLDNSCLLFS